MRPLRATQRTPASDTDDVLTPQQLANRLKISVKTVRRRAYPSLDTGERERRYYWPDVLAFLRRRSGGEIPDNR